MSNSTDEQMNAGHGASKVVPLGEFQKSSNKWMGIEDRVATGTVGSREMMTYGGDKNVGKLFKGKSLGSASRESNSGDGEGNSTNEKELKSFGPPSGTYGSRENMPKYGGESNKGKLAGKGVGSTKAANPSSQLVGGKVYPGLNLLEGTSASQKNLGRAMKGIGSGKGKNKTNE